jgi:hypothetical protein
VVPEKAERRADSCDPPSIQMREPPPVAVLIRIAPPSASLPCRSLDPPRATSIRSIDASGTRSQ